MATVTVSNEIAAPLDRVFQTFTDIEHGPTRVSGIKKLEMMSPGPVHIGTRWLETRESWGTSTPPRWKSRRSNGIARTPSPTTKHACESTRRFASSRLTAAPRSRWSSTSTLEAFHQACSRRLAGCSPARSRRVLSHDLSDLKRSIGG